MIEQNKRQDILLYLTVFITGATTMILELVGSRMIAPYFGTTIFTWTSLIGIILGSLSIGYWLGGQLADRKTSLKILSIILLTASYMCICIYLFSSATLQFIFSKYGDTEAIGALVSSIVLFTIPSIVFGMIPPYAAKLKLHELHTSGKTVGNLYALSTIGSIVGTFLTGYFLLSFMGSFQIIILLSLVLLLNSFLLDVRSFFIIKIILAILIFHLFVSNKNMDSILNKVNVMKRINSSYTTYYITKNMNHPLGLARNLMTDLRGVQSSSLVDKPDTLLFNYSKYFTFPACYGENQSVLMIGGGGFSYAKYFLTHYPENKMDVVEIDPKLTEVAETYFALPKNRPNVEIINMDGRSYLNTNKKMYNAILIDVFDTFTIPFHLVTQESISKMYQSLSSNGVVVMNIISSIESDNINLLHAYYNTFGSVFPHVEIYKVRNDPDLRSDQNAVLIAYRGQKKGLVDNCLFQEENLSARQINLQIPNTDFILTDTFAPVEFLALSDRDN